MNNTCITPREKEILRLLSKDLTYKDLAETLFISMETVKSHRKSLGRKLAVKTTGGLVRRGFELGFLQL